MPDYDYREEANKLKAKRNFGFEFFDEPLADISEKNISKSHKLEEYKEIIRRGVSLIIEDFTSRACTTILYLYILIIPYGL